MNNMVYEGFIRGAFSLESETMIDRWGDPAQLANTDEFEAGSINNVKAAISYSIAIYNTSILENSREEITEAEIDRMDTILDDIFSATIKNQIYALIEEYNSKFKGKYIKFLWQK